MEIKQENVLSILVNLATSSFLTESSKKQNIHIHGQHQLTTLLVRGGGRTVIPAKIRPEALCETDHNFLVCKFQVEIKKEENQPISI